MKKTKPNTTKARICQSKEMYYKSKTQKSESQHFNNIWPQNGAGLLSKEKMSKGGDKEK